MIETFIVVVVVPTPVTIETRAVLSGAQSSPGSIKVLPHLAQPIRLRGTVANDTATNVAFHHVTLCPSRQHVAEQGLTGVADGWTLIFYRAPPSPPQLECDDSLIELASEDLVVDDVILLSAGCRVPADARLVEAGDVLVDESIVTGESQPVEHSPAAHAEVMSGTYVLRGRGMAQVTMWATWASWQKVSSWPPWW